MDFWKPGSNRRDLTQFQDDKSPANIGNQCSLNLLVILKEKGWFEKTTIAMNERTMEAMQKTITIIRSVDKHFKVSKMG